jgi:hypothetical protein
MACLTRYMLHRGACCAQCSVNEGGEASAKSNHAQLHSCSCANQALPHTQMACTQVHLAAG